MQIFQCTLLSVNDTSMGGLLLRCRTCRHMPSHGCCVWQMSGWAGAQSLHAEGGRAVVYSGMTDCLMRTVREEGMQALFKVGVLTALRCMDCSGCLVCRCVCLQGPLSCVWSPCMLWLLVPAFGTVACRRA